MTRAAVLEYKCPCCGAQLKFSQEQQTLECEYCGNSFATEAVKECNTPIAADEPKFQWEKNTPEEMPEEVTLKLQNYTCPNCGGRIMSDKNTAASFCPYCDNPAILTDRVGGEFKPDAIIPFQNTKADAYKAFETLCKGKRLLPTDFQRNLRIEKLTGIYVPFWLYDCSGQQTEKYRCTRTSHWMDSNYNYTKTDYYLATRSAKADFSCIPLDASSKIDDTIMESIEPFDFSKLVDFNPAFLSGFFADKFDVESKSGEERVRQRVSRTLTAEIRSSLSGYTTAVSTEKRMDISATKAKYVLLPVWMLHTKYKDQTYVFAMNGQTGKMTGTFPICPKRSAGWFFGIFAAVFSVIGLLPLLFL